MEGKTVLIKQTKKDYGYMATVKYEVDGGRGYVVETDKRGEFFILSEGLDIDVIE